MDRLPKTSFVKAWRGLRNQPGVSDVEISGLGASKFNVIQPKLENVMRDGTAKPWDVSVAVDVEARPKKVRKALRRLRKQGIIQWVDWSTPKAHSGIAGRGDNVVAYTDLGTDRGTTKVVILHNPAANPEAAKNETPQDLLKAIEKALR